MASPFPNVTGIGYTPGNIDLATQQAALDRKRQMMSMLLMQAMQQPSTTQMAGPIAIRQSPLQPMARALEVYLGNKRMGDLDQQERDLIANKQAQTSDAVQQLMGAAQPTPGSPTTYTEQAGPPDAQGQSSMTVDPGTAPGFDTPGFSKAYAKAQYAGVDPALLGNMLAQFNRGRLLTNMGYGNMVPGYNGGQSSFTPGDASRGASLSLPAGVQPPAGGSFGGGTPGGAQSPGGGIGGVPGMAAAFTMSGDPALEKLGAMVNEAAKPISGRAGAPMWGRDANGNLTMLGFAPKTDTGQTVSPQGTVSTAPGYVQSATDIIGAKGRAEAPFQRPVDMPVATGGTMPTPFNQFIGAPGTAPGVSPAPAPGAPPSGMTDAQAHAYALKQDAAGLPVTVAQNGNSLFSAQPTGNAQPSAGLPRIGPQSTVAKAEASGTGAVYAKQSEAVDAAAQSATTGRATIAQMTDALNSMDPNQLTPERTKWAALAQASGLVSDDTVKKIAGGDLSAIQEFTKLSYGNSASNLRALLPGQRLTQMEILQNYVNSPNPSLQKAAISTMLQMQDGGYRWAQDKQQAKDAFVQQKGSYAGFEGWWNRNHPLTGNDMGGQPYIPTLAQVKAQLAGAQSPQVPGAAPGEIPGAQPSAAGAGAGAMPPRIVNPTTHEVRELRGGQWVTVR